jgi:hypothetical protein
MGRVRKIIAAAAIGAFAILGVGLPAASAVAAPTAVHVAMPGCREIGCV